MALHGEVWEYVRVGNVYIDEAVAAAWLALSISVSISIAIVYFRFCKG